MMAEHERKPRDGATPEEQADPASHGASGAPDAAGDLGAEPAASADESGDAEAYAGLDEVTRAKRRLLDFGAARDAERAATHRRPTCTAALVALGAGFVIARFRWLRRGLVRGAGWTVKRALFGSPAKRRKHA